jgi:surface protein
VGTDLARRAPARPPDALTLTLAPRVARSLARFYDARNFNQPLNSWDTSSVTNMSYMWVLTSPAVRLPALTRSRSRSRSLRASLARSPGSGTPRPSTAPSIAGTRVR